MYFSIHQDYQRAFVRKVLVLPEELSQELPGSAFHWFSNKSRKSFPSLYLGSMQINARPLCCKSGFLLHDCWLRTTIRQYQDARNFMHIIRMILLPLFVSIILA